MFWEKRLIKTWTMPETYGAHTSSQTGAFIPSGPPAFVLMMCSLLKPQRTSRIPSKRSSVTPAISLFNFERGTALRGRTVKSGDYNHVFRGFGEEGRRRPCGGKIRRLA